MVVIGQALRDVEGGGTGGAGGVRGVADGGARPHRAGSQRLPLRARHGGLFTTTTPPTFNLLLLLLRASVYAFILKASHAPISVEWLCWMTLVAGGEGAAAVRRGEPSGRFSWVHFPATGAAHHDDADDDGRPAR